MKIRGALIVRGALIALILAAGFGCRNGEREAKREAEAASAAPSEMPEVGTAPVSSHMNTPAPSTDSQAAVFLSRSGPAKLRLEWREIDSLTAKVALVSTNESTHCENRFTGFFQTKPGADAEILENEEGDALPATQYIYQSDSCWIEIQIAENIMKVQSADCQAKEANGCRFGSERLLSLEKSQP